MTASRKLRLFSIAWLLWAGIHIWYLGGLVNRVVVLARWTSTILTHRRASPLITGTSTADNIAVALPADGMDLKQGRLRAVLEQRAGFDRVHVAAAPTI